MRKNPVASVAAAAVFAALSLTAGASASPWLPNPTACPSAGPTLVSPTDGATVESPVTFHWSAVTGAIDYTIIITGDNGISRRIRRPDTEGVDNLPRGSYVWSVEAIVNECAPVVSDSWTFDVTEPCPVDAPDLVSPHDGATVDLPFLFEWSHVDGADSYIIHVLGPNGFSRDILTPRTEAPDDHYPHGEFTWTVEALAADCDSTYSDQFVFYVEGDCPEDGPTLLTPVDDTEAASPVTFSWSAVPDAVGYELVIFDDYGLAYDEPADGTSETLDLDPGDYEWFVVAEFEEGCEPVDSEHGYFYIPGEGDCSGEGAALLTPADSANAMNPVEFTWSEVPGAYEYELVVIGLDSDELEVVETGEGKTAASLFLDPGEYLWYVESYLDCGEVESDEFVFTIGGGANCDDEGPELVSPDDDEELTLPATFDWNPVDGALGYWLVFVAEDGAPTVVAKTGPDETTATIDSIPPGEYDWSVAALFAECDPAFSEERYFEIGFDSECDHDEPFPLLPLDGSRNVPSPMTFSWTPVDDAIGYEVWVSTDGLNFSQVGSQVTSPTLTAPVSEGQIDWWVKALFDGCPPTRSEWGFCEAAGAVSCGTPPRVVAGAVGSATSGETYTLYWSGVANGDSYEVQESAARDFKNAQAQTTSALAVEFQHAVTLRTTWYYRVRAVASCNSSKGNWSAPVAVTVEPPSTSAKEVDYTSSLGTQTPISQMLFIPGSGGSPVVGKIAPSATLTRRRPVRLGGQRRFDVTTDRSWITVSPASGTLPPEGVNVTVTMNPKGLPAGASGGTVLVSSSRVLGKSASVTGAAVPVSLSLVTPVAAATSATTSAESIILPALSASSNVVVGNLSAQALKYQVSFSPAAGGAVRQASVQVSPGSTSELDSVVGTWFGGGIEDQTGSLEIRSVGSSTSTTSGPTTIVSGLAYATAPGGTVTELVPATALGRFAEKPVSTLRPTSLVLPAVRKSASYVTDLVLLEGSGDPATAVASVFSSTGAKVDEITVSLAAREQKTIADLLGTRSLSIDAARVDVSVTSAKGKVLALGRVHDIASGDSWIITPARASDSASTAWVMPGAADIGTSGGTLRTDLWLVNRGAAAVTATLRYDAEGATTPATVDVTLEPGETKIMEKVASTLFQRPATRGAIRVETPAAATLVVGGRTYIEGASGSLGGVLRASVIEKTAALGARALQIVHIEDSDRMRTDLGIAEVTGNAATVEITATVPGALASPKVTIALAANEFKRVGSILQSMALGRVYGGRLSVRVTAGTGRIAAYGELVDLATQEPTFVPAE